MITSLIGFINSWTLLINFLCHLTVFVGLLYVAVHNRDLETWVITPLWYLGLTSGFVCITIITQWTIGPEHPMSYWTFGMVGEIGAHVILAAICAVLFLKTLKADIANRKHRQK